MTRPDSVILCGGAGQRLDGVDKPLEPLAGRPLFEHVLQRIAGQAGEIIVSANRNAAQYAGYGLRVVDDGRHAGRGPLAGIAAGLAVANAGDVLVVPGDAPLLPDDLAVRLDEARHRAGAAIAFVDDGHGPQPLCCLLPRALLADLQRYLDDGGSTPRDWQARHRAIGVSFAEWPRWGWSANTPEEWQDAELRLSDHLSITE
ncbi:MAG: molybdenum cofactor guanylyltransferase [Xanthomonadaceae bacterium]|nr:molybdenum cofactor guanylyltransferase [Xanthomonadaceae bacterium]